MMSSHRCPAVTMLLPPHALVPPRRVRADSGCRHQCPEPAGSLEETPRHDAAAGDRLWCACMALPAQEGVLMVEGTVAARLVGRNNATMNNVNLVDVDRVAHDPHNCVA